MKNIENQKIHFVGRVKNINDGLLTLTDFGKDVHVPIPNNEVQEVQEYFDISKPVFWFGEC